MCFWFFRQVFVILIVEVVGVQKVELVFSRLMILVLLLWVCCMMLFSFFCEVQFILIRLGSGMLVMVEQWVSGIMVLLWLFSMKVVMLCIEMLNFSDRKWWNCVEFRMLVMLMIFLCGRLLNLCSVQIIVFSGLVMQIMNVLGVWVLMFLLIDFMIFRLMFSRLLCDMFGLCGMLVVMMQILVFVMLVQLFVFFMMVLNFLDGLDCVMFSVLFWGVFLVMLNRMILFSFFIVVRCVSVLLICFVLISVILGWVMVNF